MNVFRSSPRRAVTGLAVAAALLAAPAAAAQGVVRSVPLSNTIDPASAGALDPTMARLPTDLWRGTARAEATSLAAAVPARLRSPALRDLARRTLAAAGRPPAGSVEAPGFAQTRAAALLRLGEAALAADLLAAIPRGSRSEADDLMLLDASLLSLDRARACAVARDRAGRAQSDAFAKASAYCEALAGDRVRAEFAAALIAETAPDDKAFFALLDQMIGVGDKAAAAVKRLKAPTPLHRAMMRAVGLPPAGLPDAEAEPAAVAIERLIAVDPSAPLGLRAKATWRVLRSNAADANAAGQLFLAVGTQKAAQGRAARISEAYVQAVSAGRGPDRALTLARLQADAQEFETTPDGEGAEIAVTTLIRPLLADMLALASGPDIAGRVARGLLLVGETEAARRWIESLEAASKVPGAPETALRLDALFALATGRDRRAFVGPEAALWLGANEAASTARDVDPAERAALLSRLRVAAGLPPSPLLDAGAATWRATAPAASDAAVALASAAGRDGVGETVLRAVLLVEAGADERATRPWRMATAAVALQAVGLKPEARRLAVEAAIAAGL